MLIAFGKSLVFLSRFFFQNENVIHTCTKHSRVRVSVAWYLQCSCLQS